MLFGINYSYPAASLLSEGRLQVDRFKCPDWPDMIAEAGRQRPVAVHFGLKAGLGLPREHDWEKIARILAETGTPYVNLHLNPVQKDFPDIPVDLPDTQQRRQLTEALLRDVAAAVERFGPERVIVENVPYHGASGKTLRPAVEPEVIRQVVTETGCGLLLDISHARIAARQLGFEEADYLNSLPVERLRELHFTGLHWVNGRWQDHLSVQEPDWVALEWVLDRIRAGDWNRPWMLAFEYGGVGEKFAGRSDPAVIAGQAVRLYEKINPI